jgi:HEAT repeat protein
MRKCLFIVYLFAAALCAAQETQDVLNLEGAPQSVLESSDPLYSDISPKNALDLDKRAFAESGQEKAIEKNPHELSERRIKEQIGFLLRTEGTARCIDLYQKHRTVHQEHDFELLEQMALLTLEKISHENNLEKQLLSIFGLKIAGVSSSVDLMSILERALKKDSLPLQLVSIQFLGQLQDDRSDELLTRAMNSVFFLARMEAAYQLIAKKARKALGQIEALMQKVPPVFRSYFPPLFAELGTSDAIKALRLLIDDPDVQVRIASMLSAAMYGRDDLLPAIRRHLSHAHSAEKEACIAALGMLNDGHSLSHIKACRTSSSPSLQLATLRTLYSLGDETAKEEIIALAKKKNLFAISLLADISGTEEILAELIKEENLQTRANAALSLLRHRDPRCTETILELLIKDTRDLGFYPQFSVGASLSTLKVLPSVQQHQKEEHFDFDTITLGVKETILRECLELPERNFISLSRSLFNASQSDLIPLLISSLENKRTPEAIHLLKEYAHKSFSPFIRIYCTLSLFRLREEGPYQQMLYDWLSQNKKQTFVRFRPMLPRTSQVKGGSFELTPEESSRLLVESYTALANHHDKKSIDVLLEALKEGHPKNQAIIAGLLLRAIQ